MAHPRPKSRRRRSDERNRKPSRADRIDWFQSTTFGRSKASAETARPSQMRTMVHKSSLTYLREDRVFLVDEARFGSVFITCSPRITSYARLTPRCAYSCPRGDPWSGGRYAAWPSEYGRELVSCLLTGRFWRGHTHFLKKKEHRAKKTPLRRKYGIRSTPRARVGVGLGHRVPAHGCPAEGGARSNRERFEHNSDMRHELRRRPCAMPRRGCARRAPRIPISGRSYLEEFDHAI